MSEITSAQWLAELDRLIDSSSSGRRVVVIDRGFTVYDVMERCGFKRWKALMIIQDGMKHGRVKHIGFRPGQEGCKVYETIKGE